MGEATLYGVGVGPGDPELLTLAAVRCVRACPVVASPQTRDGAMVALDIVRAEVDLSDKQVVPLRFTMSPDAAVRSACHEKLAGELCSYLARGLDVALLNLGDVSIYATYQHVAPYVRSRGFRCRAVAGVPSFCAIAATLGENLTPGMDTPLHVFPAAYADVRAACELEGTKVLMKAGKDFPETREQLRRAGALSRAALVQDCGLENERVVPNLADAPEDELATSYFSTVVVRP